MNPLHIDWLGNTFNPLLIAARVKSSSSAWMLRSCYVQVVMVFLPETAGKFYLVVFTRLLMFGQSVHIHANHASSLSSLMFKKAVGVGKLRCAGVKWTKCFLEGVFPTRWTFSASAMSTLTIVLRCLSAHLLDRAMLWNIFLCRKINIYPFLTWPSSGVIVLRSHACPCLYIKP